MNINQKIIDKLSLLNKPGIIAISGFGGSGKSTLASQLGKLFESPVVTIDSFIKKEKPQTYANWEIMDFERFTNDLLAPFYQGKNPIIFQPSRWETGELLPEITIKHNGLLIVEGVGILQPTLMKYYTYSIWIDCPAEEALKRGKKRDSEVYHYPQDELWNGLWKENDKQFFEKFRPDTLANELINNG